MKHRIAILANGPSLREFDFARLTNVDTLGMNAAYRYWEKIDWRPNHYVCLDDALIDTHNTEIRRLIEEGRIRSYFLSGHILKYHPDLAKRKDVRFLDEFMAHWHIHRGKKFGLKLHSNLAFETRSDSLLTTGAYAVRYAAMLGYEDIGLFGFDLVYASPVFAKTLEGNRLVVTETPKTNPNYFFDDYQQAGDLFHVPNPESHNGELHVEAFRVLRDDFAENGVPAHLHNTNPASRLASEGIFPFQRAETFLDEPLLSSVVVPVTQGEKTQLLASLTLMAQPAGSPWLGRKPDRLPQLVVVFNNDEAAAAEVDIRALFDVEKGLKDSFGGLRFINLELSGDADRYERSNRGRRGEHGLRAGPNHLFFGAMEAVAGLPGHSLYMETDCVAVRPGWLNKANALLAGSHDHWVMGSIYLGLDPLGPTETRHMNGNALYAAGDPGFRAFLKDVWKPHLQEMLNERPELPFDCVIEDMFQRADSRRAGADRYWPVVQSIAHRILYSPFIANLAGEKRDNAVLAELVARTLRDLPDCHIVHSRQLAETFRKQLDETGSAEISSVLSTLRGEGVSRSGPIIRSLSDPAQPSRGRIASLKRKLRQIAQKRRS